VDDPASQFNSRLDSKTVRAVDYFEGSAIDEDSLRRLVEGAVTINRS
jgi:hypothetical protein